MKIKRPKYYSDAKRQTSCLVCYLLGKRTKHDENYFRSPSTLHLALDHAECIIDERTKTKIFASHPYPDNEGLRNLQSECKQLGLKITVSEKDWYSDKTVCVLISK